MVHFLATLQDFLANVREKSIFIGEVAMHQVRWEGHCDGILVG